MKRSYGQTVLFLLMGLLFSVSAFAQDISVKGVVQDSNGDPLVGATVTVKGTQIAVATDFDGKFTVKAPKGGAIIVTYIGYNPVEVFASEKPMVITMDESTELLDEVVVLGYGAEQRKQDLSAAVGVVTNTAELEKRPVTSTEAMLQGALPGVTVIGWRRPDINPLDRDTRSGLTER